MLRIIQYDVLISVPIFSANKYIYETDFYLRYVQINSALNKENQKKIK